MKSQVPITLIQLVSEQTMQNLLPLLALRPSRVVQLCSQGRKFADIARHLEQSAREAGVIAEFQLVELPSPTPDPEHVRHEMKQLLPVFPDAVVNLTGGTKLMSLGAYLGASEFPVPLLYCDTERRQFLPIGRCPLPAMPSFTETARGLTVRTVMTAHGSAPDAWRFDSASPAALEFGRRAFELRWERRNEFDACDYSRRIRKFFRGDANKITSNKTKLEALCASDILSAMPDPVPEVIRLFLAAAADGGFLRAHSSGGFCLKPCPARGLLRGHVERAANLLEGSWLELTILDLVRRSARFSDAHWSVEPAAHAPHTAAQAFGETDVICLALPQGALQLISCKTSLVKPLEHLEALKERAHNLGGRYAKAMLAVLFPWSEQVPELRRWERLLGVQVLVGNEVIRHLA